MSEDFKDEISLKSCSVELLGLGITLAARCVSKLFNRELAKDGITMTQAYVMYAIAEYRGYNLSYLAKKLHMESSALKVCMDSIKKYVRIYKDSVDKRAVYPALTKQGAKFLKEIMPKVIKIEEKIGNETKDKEFFVDFIHRFSSDIVKATKVSKSRR